MTTVTRINKVTYQVVTSSLLDPKYGSLRDAYTIL